MFLLIVEPLSSGLTASDKEVSGLKPCKFVINGGIANLKEFRSQLHRLLSAGQTQQLQARVHLKRESLELTASQFLPNSLTQAAVSLKYICTSSAKERGIVLLKALGNSKRAPKERKKAHKQRKPARIKCCCVARNIFQHIDTLVSTQMA